MKKNMFKLTKTKEKKRSQLILAQRGDHNARQDPRNTTVRQRTGDKKNPSLMFSGDRNSLPAEFPTGVVDLRTGIFL